MAQLLNRICQLTGNLPIQLVSLAFPPECVLCQTPLPTAQRLCAECHNKIVSHQYSCQRCAMPVPTVLSNTDCSRCRDHRWHFSRVIALGHYQGKLREAVILCKKIKAEPLRYAIAAEMATKLVERLPDLAREHPLILPVPYYWTRAFARTASTASNLAELIANLTGWPLSLGIIRRTRKTSKQGMLSLAERQQNVRGAFCLNGSPNLTGRHLLVIDDVLTSGSTVNEIAKQLTRCNPADISVLTIARATGV